MTTVAPGTAAPEESSTDPSRRPLAEDACPKVPAGQMRVKNNTKKENDRAKPKIEAHEFLRMNIQDPPKMDKLELFKSLACFSPAPAEQGISPEIGPRHGNLNARHDGFLVSTVFSGR